MIRCFENQGPQIDKNAFIDETAVIIGQVTIGADCSIWPLTVLRGDVNSITIGQRTNIQDSTVIHVNHANPSNLSGDPVMIGSDVTIGHRVLLHACHIADRCLIGMGAIIMDRVVIEPDVFVGGGSLVTPGKVLKSGYLYTGSPARSIRPLRSDEKENILYSAGHYVRLGKRHQQENKLST